ncbi:hypothetical protein FRT60_08795 [Pseudomonas haemolytica]|uniref:Uncharacterized protein n=1 Tax=Pseudomonas haemolytica TaxID=2600065 RepID=A0A5P1D9V6_9PSED|nr:hypothetical protein [Pseudomonas haemolytica]MRJ37261.1 hypothetical protein [Pseudomonas haemolytica]
MSDYGHTEPRRGAEWWGESPLVTLGLFSKVTRCKSGTNSSRYLSNGYLRGTPPTHPIYFPPHRLFPPLQRSTSFKHL